VRANGPANRDSELRALNAANLDPRTVRRARLTLALAAAAAFGLAYLLSSGFCAEMNRAAGILYWEI
jgi:hypothetical protein